MMFANSESTICDVTIGVKRLVIPLHSCRIWKEGSTSADVTMSLYPTFV